MDDLNSNENLEVRGAGGGGGGGKQKTKQNVTVVAPTRQPVIEADNLFSVAFAKTVYAIGEGVIEGFPNSIEKDVFLDSVPIKNPDDSENFTGYEVESRLGEDETQTPIEGFSTTENTVGVNVAITQSTGAITRSITDTDTERCRVIVSHPSLQAQNPNNGDVSGTTVEYKIEVSSNSGPYSTVAQPVVTGKSDSEFQRAYEFDLPGTGPWTIRLSRVTADSDSIYLQNGISWQAFVEIIDEKFAYPNTALVAVKVDARQFNNIPDVSMRVRGKRVQVPSNYNAETRVYTGVWDGTFQMAWTDNPAWIFRDIVVNDRFGVARYVNSIAIDPWYLYTVSQYCDELVPDGSGGTEPRFTCNVYLQNAGGVYEVLNALASCFRGLIYYSEGELYVTQDREQLPVQQFSEANVIQDVAENGEVSSPCFTYSGTARAARKTVVLANWDDPNQAYSGVTEYQQDDELLERFGYNPVDLRLLGVTSRGQALRAAKHTLFSNRYETERITFRIGAEGLAAGVGEVIQVADPLKQGQRLGGRVTEVNGNDIVIDATLNLSDSIEYTLTLVIPDGETVTNPDGTTVTRPKLQVYNLVSFQNAGFETIDAKLTSQGEDPLLTQNADFLVATIINSDASRTRIRLDSLVDTQVGSIWVLEWSAMQAALYKVISVAEIEPLIYQVDAVQYNNSKFAYVDNDLPIAVPKDRFKLRAVEEPTDLEAALVYSNGQTSINANWKAPQFNNTIDLLIRGYRYQWRKTGDTEWSDIRQQNATTVEIPLAKHVFGNTYQVRVATINRLGGQSDWATYDVDAFPAIPDLSDSTFGATVTHANQPDGTQLIIVNPGTTAIPERVNGYRCWCKPRALSSGEVPGVKPPGDDGWYFLVDIPLTGYYTVAFHAPDTYDVRVNFTSAIFGETPTDYIYDVVERGEITPPSPNNFSVVENQDSSGKRFSWQLPQSEYGSWDQNIVADIVGYQVRYKRGTLALNNIVFDVSTDLISVNTTTVTGTIGNQHLLNVGDEIKFAASSGTLPTGITSGTTYYVASDGFTSTSFKVSATSGGAAINLTGTATGTYNVSGPDALKARLDVQATWGAGIELASGGLPAQQQWFETSLFDTDSYVVMVKAVDATQWRSDVPARVLVNIGAKPISNAVQTINAKTQGAGNWPGTYDNCSVVGGNLVQTDPTIDSYFTWNFDNNNLSSALLFSTTATATYAHALVALTGEATEITQEDDFNLLQENDDKIFAEQRYYTDTELAEGGVVHPYAPYEKLLGDVYRVETRFKSPDGGVTAGNISALSAQLDYPDVVEKINDASISSSGTAVNLTKTFRAVESVSVTALQGSTAVTARIVSKTTSAITVECLNSSGTAVSGTVDLIVTGY
jgi:predicted phage tail protein